MGSCAFTREQFQGELLKISVHDMHRKITNLKATTAFLRGKWVQCTHGMCFVCVCLCQMALEISVIYVPVFYTGTGEIVRLGLSMWNNPKNEGEIRRYQKCTKPVQSCLKSPTTWLFDQPFFRKAIKTTNAWHYWPFMRQSATCYDATKFAHIFAIYIIIRIK